MLNNKEEITKVEIARAEIAKAEWLYYTEDYNHQADIIENIIRTEGEMAVDINNDTVTYWKREPAYFHWEFNPEEEKKAILAYEPEDDGCRKLLFYHKIDAPPGFSPSPKLYKTVFKYENHYISPCFYDLTTEPENATIEEEQMVAAAEECYRQIEEEAKDIFDSQYKAYQQKGETKC